MSFYINSGNVPDLYVSDSFTDMVKSYQKNKSKMSRSEKEALLYAKEKVERARALSTP